jgi:hypothetical protein
MAKITVYPTKESALNIKHPSSGLLKLEGSQWEMDGFTARMLCDEAVTQVKERAFKSTKEPVDPTQPPAHATD